ncbi:MAG: MurR/RpiR family transcriptional regulator [Woeseiaceae bacterium]|nr:MurR/RpiR family transcriptional regulator [Woeseiaceae bacterium]
MLYRIKRRIPDLSKAEKRVAEWILAHPRRAASATLADVAAASGASEPTVIRFCRRIGLDGFRDLTLKLAETLSRPASYIHRDVDATDSAKDAIEKVLDASIRTLINTRTMLQARPFEDATTALKTARQIIFIGVGASGHVANDASQKFFRLGIPCSSMPDQPSIQQLAAVTTTGDVLVFVSAAGRRSVFSAAAELARSNGATVIAVTDPSSQLAKAVDIVLPAEPGEDASIYTPMGSRLAHLALLDALLVLLALSLGTAATDRLRASKDAISGEFSV